MPKKREKKDPNFDVGPGGHTRKAQGYDPAKDKRGIKKELMKIKGKGSLSNKKCHKLWKKSKRGVGVSGKIKIVYISKT